MKIVTDSAADIPRQELESLGITIAPLKIQFPGGEISSEEMTPDEFYNRLREMEPAIPTTSQPSSGEFQKLYEDLSSNGEKEILSIHISSGLSGTVESARLAARQVEDARVTVVDTMTLSGGERFQVLAAHQMAEAGASVDEILLRLETIRDLTEVTYTLDTLKYLARGGRIGRVQALAGSLLHLKPVITVDKVDGKYNNTGRGRTLKKAMSLIIAHLNTTYGKDRSLWITLLHGQFLDQAKVLEEMLRSELTVGFLEVLRVSPVLGVHTGPGVVGAATIPLDMMEGVKS